MQTLSTSTSRRWLFRPPPAHLFRPNAQTRTRVKPLLPFRYSVSGWLVTSPLTTDGLRALVDLLPLPSGSHLIQLWRNESTKFRRACRLNHAWLVSATIVSLFSQLIAPSVFEPASPIYAAEVTPPVSLLAESSVTAPLGPVEPAGTSLFLGGLWSDFSTMTLREAVAAQVPDLYDTFRGLPKLQNPDQDLSNLPATQAYIERYRPADDWLDTVERKPLSGIYRQGNEYWKENGQILKIEDGWVITHIPDRMAPLYEYVEQLTGVSRYILMAVATIESKQGISTKSGTNCQGWGHFCPGTISLFEGKDLLPENFDSYDPYDGIMGIAIHLRVSALGTGAYKNLFKPDTTFDTIGWPDFWNGETPSFNEFEAMSKKYPLIQAAWGYNRSAFYGYSVAHLAKFYQERDIPSV